MRFATLRLISFLATGVGCVFAIPPAEWDHTVHGGKDDRGKCGTTRDANLADCEVLLYNPTVFMEKHKFWNFWTFNEREGLVGSSAANRVSCNGRRCVYFNWKGNSDWTADQLSDAAVEAVRLDALSLLGRANRDKGLINGVGRFMIGTDDEHNVCIANLDSARHCFGDVGDSS